MMNRFLALLLSLLLATPSLYAASPLPIVAVVEVNVPEEAAAQSAIARASFWQAFSQSGRVKLVNRNDIEVWKSRYGNTQEKDDGKEKLKDARELLVRGKQAFNRLEFSKSVSFLEEARRIFIQNLHLLRTNRDLIDSHLYLGTAYVASKKLDLANEEFKRVVYLDPKKEITSKDFSPKVMGEFAKAKQEVMAQDAIRVRLTSAPSGAAIYLNGRPNGTTPAEFTLKPGSYFILLEKEGLQPWYQPVQLSRRLQNIHVPLKTSADDAEWTHLFRVREGSDAQSEDMKDVASLARSVGAQVVLFSDLKKDTEYRLFGQLWDARTDDFSKVVVQNLGEDTSDLPATAKDVTEELLKQLRSNGYVVPAEGGSQIQDMTVGAADRPKQGIEAAAVPEKAWYQKWWIWPIVGAVGAGIVVGAVTFAGSNQSGKIVINNGGNF
jgi:hypothetical protein